MVRPMDTPPPDVLAGDPRHDRTLPTHTPLPGEVLELTGFVGSVVAATAREVTLEDRRGRRRAFPYDDRVAWRGETAVRLVAPLPRPTASPVVTTRSGSVAVTPTPAGVARASRIWVEGVHDADLLELVWGDDLRDARVVVEPLGGIDDLVAEVARFRPGPSRRLGVLVDHLVAGSKESRITSRVRHPAVLVTGHPYVDVWAAVRPERMGLEAWPDIPLGTPWKEGICAAVGVPDPPTLWRTLRGRVRDWRDLEQPLVRAVEELLDHVTAGD
jgi:hypothetical protein